jgi:ribosomal protein S13
MNINNYKRAGELTEQEIEKVLERVNNPGSIKNLNKL